VEGNSDEEEDDPVESDVPGKPEEAVVVRLTGAVGETVTVNVRLVGMIDGGNMVDV